ncbi:MAG: radical SAM protein [Sulfurimonadaceae bacterium]
MLPFFKDIFLCDYQELVEQKKSIVVFGLSETTKRALQDLDIVAIADNNQELHGTLYKGIPLISSDELREYSTYPIILWGNHVAKILPQLLQKGMSNIIIVQDKSNALFSIKAEYLRNDATNLSLELQKTYFKKLVSHIDIELYSYCNRTCWFCPNSFLERKNHKEFLDPSLYTTLLQDLASITYDGCISFNGYSEPFGNEFFYERLHEAKELLPHALLAANTNCDFLDDNALQKAYESGLRQLNMQIYLQEEELFTPELVAKKLSHLQKRLRGVVFDTPKIRHDLIEYPCSYHDMHIRAYARDFRVNGIDRSDLEVQTHPSNRNTPCTISTNQVIINYKAQMLPCCHIRSDYDKHASLVFATLQKKPASLFEAYFSKKSLAWKKSLLYFDTTFASPCTNCLFHPLADNAVTREYVATLNASL